MKTINKPIILTFGGMTPFSQHTFKVQLAAYGANYDDIYEGRCIADADGKADIAVDDICRAYMRKELLTWNDDRQGYVPTALADIEEQREPTDGILALLLVSVSGGGYTSEQTAIVWDGWQPGWQQGELVFTGGETVNLALLGNAVVPHLPPVATTNMWLELVMQWFVNEQPQLGSGPIHRVTLSTAGAGCYDIAFTLRDLFASLFNGEVDGGVSNSTFDTTVDGGDSDDAASDDVDGGDSDEVLTVVSDIDINLYHGADAIPVAHVDRCPSPYYVAWRLPSGGWFCWGFDGNTTEQASPTVATLHDYRNSDRVTAMDVQQQYNLFSGFLTREQYNIITTIAYAREVYLYNVETDKGVWCSVENRALPTAGNVRWRNEPINITLKEIVHKEL